MKSIDLVGINVNRVLYKRRVMVPLLVAGRGVADSGAGKRRRSLLKWTRRG